MAERVLAKSRRCFRAVPWYNAGMTRRYFMTDLPPAGGVIALPEDEAAHAARVMRVSVGDPVVLFSGDGNEATGVIESVHRRQVYVHLNPPVAVSREAKHRIELAVSLPKGDRAKLLVEKLTELGVAKLTPLICKRTQGQASGKNLEKLQRYVIEASKQCERNVLMEVCEAVPFGEWVAGTEQAPSTSIRIISHPTGRSIRESLAEGGISEQGIREPSESSPQSAGGSGVVIMALIGPEGGFADEEVEQAIAAGWKCISLGPRILRVETAAVALVSRLVVD